MCTQKVRSFFIHFFIIVSLMFLTVGTNSFADIIVDNGGPGSSYTGTWPESGAPDSYGTRSVYARPDATYTWQFDSQPSGEYEVMMWWTSTDTRGSAISVDIHHTDGTETVIINQTANGGYWNSLGTYYFDSSGSVTITASGDLLPDGRTVSTCADAVWFRYVSSDEIIIDNGNPGTSSTGTWSPSSGPNFYGSNSLYARPDATYTWSFNSESAGTYQVYMWWTATTTRGDSIPVNINGLETVTVNQRTNGGQWNYLGTYGFDGSGYVTITAVGSTSTCADAVRFVPVSTNSLPTATIVSITPNPAPDGADISFVGEGSDDDGTIAAYEWSSSLDGILSSDASFVSSMLTEGVHEISFRVQDDEGAWSVAVTDSLTVGNLDPVAVIDSISPNPAGPGVSVVFTGHGDAFGGATITAYNWESDLDGSLSSEASFSANNLSLGTHVISFTVTDSNGEVSEAVQQELDIVYPDIIIDNGDPGTSSTGTWFISGGSSPYGSNSLYARPDATYTWQFDSQPAGMYNVYIWYTATSTRGDAVPVNINGLETVTINQLIDGGQWNYLGTYAFNGSGFVTVTAVGSTSTCADAVRFEYISSNNPPTAEITEITPNPADSGESIFFSGQGTDTDGTIAGYLWESSIDGTLSDQASFSAVLSDGPHEISFSVRDNEGAWSSVVSQALTVGEVLYTLDYDNGENTSSTGEWLVSARPNSYGDFSLYSRDGATYTWHFTPPVSANYIVNMWWTDYSNRSSSVPVEILYEGGSQTVYINQQVNGGQWNSLGQYYFEAGNTYTVMITAQPGPSSTCADAVQFVQVSENQPPVANFTADTTGGVLPVTVGFSDLSIGDIDTWLWDFGDGETSTEQSPTHEYTDSGSYTVSLTVTNAFGSDTETKTAFIQIYGSNTENIYVAMGWGSTGDEWLITEYSISSLGAVEIEPDVWRYTNTDKGITYYIRRIDTVEAFEAAIKEEGSHVIFVGHSNYGWGLAFLTYSQQGAVRYFDDPLVSNVSTDMTDPSIAGLRITQAYPNWNPEYSFGGSAIMPYDFGDPNGPPPYNYFATYTLPGDPTHYRVEGADGSYVERFPDCGRPAWYSPDGSPPDPDLNPEYFITNPGDDWERCEFVGTWESATPGDWHEAVYYIGQNYMYHTPGVGNNSATFTLPVEFPGVYAVVATWYPEAINASNATYMIQHTDVGTGEYDTVVVDQRQSAVFNILGAYYFGPGSYTVQITDNADGNVVADVAMLMYVDDPQLITKAEFSVDQNTGSGPMTVQFIDQSTVYNSANLMPEIEWQWDFGDGSSSQNHNPMHTYMGPGIYTVSLTVTDDLGNFDTETKESFIIVDSAAPLHAEFTADKIMGAQGRVPVNFLDQSTGDITEWLWDFGDGTTSTEQSPTHNYVGAGTYTVTLTVTGPGGSDEETETDFVYSTVGMVLCDNTFDTKPHYYRNYSGTLLGSTILDASPVAFPSEEMRYSRFFFNGCVSENYYLPKFTHGVVFYTLGSRDIGVDPTDEYLTNYLLGATDQEILQAINAVNYIHGYYDFTQLPPSMR